MSDSIKLDFLDIVHKEIEKEVRKICEKEMEIYREKFGFTREDMYLWLESSRCDLIVSMISSKMMCEETKPMYEIDVVDNHGSHHIKVKEIKISHLKEVNDIEKLLFNLPNSVVLRLKKEIIKSKDPAYLSLLKYFDQEFDLKPE